VAAPKEPVLDFAKDIRNTSLHGEVFGNRY
jgi:hypothetical protein